MKATTVATHQANEQRQFHFPPRADIEASQYQSHRPLTQYIPPFPSFLPPFYLHLRESHRPSLGASVAFGVARHEQQMPAWLQQGRVALCSHSWHNTIAASSNKLLLLAFRLLTMLTIG